MGQNVVAGSMLVLQGALGNVPRGVWLDPRLSHKDTSPRLAVELPVAVEKREKTIISAVEEKQGAIDDKTGKGLATENVIEKELIKPLDAKDGLIPGAFVRNEALPSRIDHEIHFLKCGYTQ